MQPALRVARPSASLVTSAARSPRLYRLHRLQLPRLHRKTARRFSASPTASARYGFIGLGQMGYSMALNLHAKLDPAADSLALFDINPVAGEKLKQAAAAGAPITVVASVVEAAKDADYVVTVLPEPVHVKGVYKEIVAGGLSTKKKTLLVDCSTIDPASSRAVAASVAAAPGDAVFVDAPMSGGVVGASAGTLTFMLGAPATLVPDIEPLLLKMGKKVLHCGDQGAGLAAKLANNYLLAINNIGTAEAMNLGVQLGLDPKVLARVINVSTGRCWPSEVNNPVAGVVPTAPANRDYAGGFGIALMRKDLRLAMAAAQGAGAKLALADAASGLYESAEKTEQCRGRDFSVVYRHLGGKEPVE